MKNKTTVEDFIEAVEDAVAALKAKLVADGVIKGGSVTARTGGGTIPPEREN